jgi:hypothetical protein
MSDQGGARAYWMGAVCGAVVIGLGGGVALGRAGQARDVAVAAPAPVVRFAAHAVGTASRATGLAATPGGVVVGQVPAGTALRVGGRARLPAGLGLRELYWVGYADGAGSRHGFVVAEDVLLTAGEPPLLDLAGVSAADLGTPQAAVRQPSLPTARRDEAGGAGAEARVAAGLAPGAGTAASGRIEIAWLPDTVARWSAQLVAAGARHGVDPELLAIVTLVESGGGPRAVSPAGAVGLMQVMPATAAGIAQEIGLADHALARLYEPAYNLDLGAYYLAQQLARFGRADDPGWQRSVELAAAAYNGGPGALGRALAGGSLPAEAVRYQRWVGGLWRERREARSGTLDQWLAAGGQALVARAAEQ